MNTNENNKLIAEFMGFKECEGSYYRPIYNSGDWVSDVDLKFDTSWNWLMPVINKCYQEHMSKHIAEAVMTCNIDEAYKVVLKFIKDHNN